MVSFGAHDRPVHLAAAQQLLHGLRRLTAEVLSFYLESFPIATYLAAEQQAGRVAATARPEVVAELLVGACLHCAFLVRFAGETATPDQIERFAADVVNALEPALRTPSGTTRSPQGVSDFYIY